MGNGVQGYGVYGQWDPGGMGHIGNGSHGQWGLWAMGPMGNGAHGRLGHFCPQHHYYWMDSYKNLTGHRY